MKLRAFSAVVFCAALVGTPAAAQEPSSVAQVADAAVSAAEGGMRLTTAVEIAVLLTVLSLLPAILITLTSFTRIVIVLSFVRRSLALQELPPNPVVIGLALFLTSFVMAPVMKRVHAEAYEPYRAGELPAEEAGEVAWTELRSFLIANTRQAEIDLFLELADVDVPADGVVPDPDGLPFRVVVPAFVLSELKTAFQMGFLLFLPFLVIDLVIASVLISMGMFMLPPIMISTKAPGSCTLIATAPTRFCSCCGSRKSSISASPPPARPRGLQSGERDRRAWCRSVDVLRLVGVQDGSVRRHPHNAALMTEKGVLVSINSDSAEEARHLNQEAAKTMKWGGLTEEQALALITINAAKQLRIDDRVGSIEVGKDGDFAIFNEHPLSVYAVAQTTIVDGEIYFDRDDDAARREAMEEERRMLLEKSKKASEVTQ